MQKIKISDKELKRAIRSQLELKHRQITSIDMEKLKELHIYDVADLAGLEYASNLKELMIYKTSIKDFSVIAKLTNLRKLHIETDEAFDISTIFELPQLRELYLNWKHISRFITPNKSSMKISYTTLLNKVFDFNKFTNKHRLAVEKYLFDPSKNTAIQAIKATPKASMFVADTLDEDEIDQVIKEQIQNPKVYIRYLKDLKLMPDYEVKFEKYVCQYGSKKAKKFLLNDILSNNTVEEYDSRYDWYKSRIEKGYIL